jgi:uncharacterized membrane protein
VATLILGSAYFIKYAFENNWVTPWMRVLIGSVAGLGLVEAGRRFAARDLGAFGQVLQGGGIAVLYVAAYAALAFYALVAPPAAFGWMVAITALAAWRADAERSQGLAVLAVTGGFLTPFLVGGDADRPHVLFTYVALLVAGTLWLSRRHTWPLLHVVSWSLTVLTLLAWTDRAYTPARRLSTELWITVLAALFVLIWRTVPRSTALADQLARTVLGATPLVYHVASLEILWRWTPGLLVYLIAFTAVGVSAAGHWRQPWLRFATWLLVAVPTLSWLMARPARWDTAPFVALAGIYALHLVSQFREQEPGEARPTAMQVALLHLNGLWFWGGLYLLLEKLAVHRLGMLTFALAAWNAALAAGHWRRARETALHFLALAGALAAAAVALEFDGAAVTVAWAVEGAAVAARGLATGRWWLRAGGLALLGAAVIRVVEDLGHPAAAGAFAVLNVRALLTLGVVALLLLLARAYQRSGAAGRVWTPRVVAGLVVSAALMILAWMSAEVVAWFARNAWAGQASAGVGAITSANLAREVTLSTLWAAYALLLVALGMRRNYRPLRVLAIGLFAATATKVFAVDLARLDRFYRILSTVGLGLLLLMASYLYQRFRRVGSGASPPDLADDVPPPDAR